MEKEQEKVSVIMAVYKAEKYLDKAVKSVLAQTYTNFELILVDDGSPDNCPAMCDDYAKQDDRVKVVHKQNGGVSSAWNAGLDNSTGDYICFVDSDDWVEKEYIQKLYEALKKYDCDISMCSGTRLFEDGSASTVDKTANYVNKFYKVDEVLTLFFGEKHVMFINWGNLYKKDIFNNLRFPENVYCWEDTYIICDIYNKLKTGIATLEDRLYNYLVRQGSVSRAATEKRFDIIKVSRHRCEMLDKNHQSYKYCCRHLFNAYNLLYRQLVGWSRKDLIPKLNQLLKEDWKIYSKYLTKRDKFKYGMFKNCRWLYYLIVKVKRLMGK